MICFPPLLSELQAELLFPVATVYPIINFRMILMQYKPFLFIHGVTEDLQKCKIKANIKRQFEEHFRRRHFTSAILLSHELKC